MPENTETRARLLLRNWEQSAYEIDEQQNPQYAEHLRAQSGAMQYAHPQLFHHVKMDTPRRKPMPAAKPMTLAQRFLSLFRARK